MNARFGVLARTATGRGVSHQRCRRDCAALSNGAACQSTVSNPARPPWSAFGPLFTTRVYVAPSRVKRPFAIRLPYRPTIAPKCGVLRSEPAMLS